MKTEDQANAFLVKYCKQNKDSELSECIQLALSEIDSLKGNTLKATKLEILSRNDWLNHLFVTAFAESFHNYDKNPIAERLANAESLEIRLVVNGISLDVISALKSYDNQTDRMIKEKAEELLLDKIPGFAEKMTNLSNDLTEHVENELRKAGIKDSRFY